MCTISDKRKPIGTNDVFYGKYELDKKKSRLTFGSFYATCLCHPTLISACHESHKRNRSASASFGPLHIVFIILNHLYKGHGWINCMHTQHLLYLFGVSIALSLVKINKIYVKFLCKIPYKTKFFDYRAFAGSTLTDLPLILTFFIARRTSLPYSCGTSTNV